MRIKSSRTACTTQGVEDYLGNRERTCFKIKDEAGLEIYLCGRVLVKYVGGSWIQSLVR